MTLKCPGVLVMVGSAFGGACRVDAMKMMCG
jgi:hypothetical protein